MDKPNEDEIYHLLPIDDTHPHTESINCLCNPVGGYNKDGKFLVVHNAFDGRELMEESKKNLEENLN